MTTVFIGLGSNINPTKNFELATRMLRRTFPGIVFSSIYQSTPMYMEEQNDFLNAVAKFETNQSPEKIFESLRKIESRLHKNTLRRYGPRTIDLDLLLYGDITIQNERICIPHEKMKERRFVLEPLCELKEPDSIHPVCKKTWKSLLANAMHQRCSKIK